MVTELTPDNFFASVNSEGPLHVVMHYGATCGPCKRTMPHYEALVQHFAEHNITNVKFYKFHQWEPAFKQFIEEHKLNTNGVPTFRYYYFGEKLHEIASSYGDPNKIKEVIKDVVQGIESTIGEFSLYES